MHPVKSPWRKTEPGVDGKQCGARWEHESGAWVQHCGHPTALRPYYGRRADGTQINQLPASPGRQQGQTFRRLTEAQAAASGE